MKALSTLSSIYDLDIMSSQQTEIPKPINGEGTPTYLYIIMVMAIVILAIAVISCFALIIINAKKKQATNQNTNNNANNTKGIIGLIILILVLIGVIIGLSIYIQTPHNSDNPNNESTPGLLSRKATLSDITVTEDNLDLSSLGEKLSFTANKNIDGLKLKFVFQTSKGKSLQTIEKSVGNTKEGQQYSVTISITELNWEVIKNAFDLQCKYTVSAGTVSYFA